MCGRPGMLEAEAAAYREEGGELANRLGGGCELTDVGDETDDDDDAAAAGGAPGVEGAAGVGCGDGEEGTAADGGGGGNLLPAGADEGADMMAMFEADRVAEDEAALLQAHRLLLVAIRLFFK